MQAIDGSEYSLKAAEYALDVEKSFNFRAFCNYSNFCSTIMSSWARRCTGKNQ